MKLVAVLFLAVAIFSGMTGCASKPKTAAGKAAEVPQGDPWFRAIRLGDVAVMKGMVAGGKDVNTTAGRGFTGLMMAARAGNPEVVNWMLAQGADAKKKDADGQSALVYALVGLATGPKRERIVEALIKAGADPFAIDVVGFQPVREMLQLEMDSQIRSLKFTAKKGCDLVPTPQGERSLSNFARRLENVPMAEFFEKEGCW